MTRRELSREPLMVGSDYSRHPIPGQMALDLPAAGERNAFDFKYNSEFAFVAEDAVERLTAILATDVRERGETEGCRWGHHFNPTTGACDRCSYPRSAE